MNNQMITNHLGLFVNENKSYEKSSTYHAVPYKVPYKYTYEDTPARTRA